jgi:hypothetical protein
MTGVGQVPTAENTIAASSGATIWTVPDCWPLQATATRSEPDTEYVLLVVGSTVGAASANPTNSTKPPRTKNPTMTHATVFFDFTVSPSGLGWASD